MPDDRVAEPGKGGGQVPVGESGVEGRHSADGRAGISGAGGGHGDLLGGLLVRLDALLPVRGAAGEQGRMGAVA